jgi:hypothetical protein
MTSLSTRAHRHVVTSLGVGTAMNYVRVSMVPGILQSLVGEGLEEAGGRSWFTVAGALLGAFSQLPFHDCNDAVRIHVGGIERTLREATCATILGNRIAEGEHFWPVMVGGFVGVLAVLVLHSVVTGAIFLIRGTAAKH